jgi:hypothetical protein
MLRAHGAGSGHLTSWFSDGVRSFCIDYSMMQALGNRVHVIISTHYTIHLI